MTAESFAKWKMERKEKEKREREEQLQSKMEEFKKMKAGMKTGMSFSGKELFDFNPELRGDDDDDADAVDDYTGYYNQSNEEEASEVVVEENLFEDVAGLEDE